MKKIETIWFELEEDVSQSAGILYKRYSLDVLPNLFIALRVPEKNRCICILVNKKNVPDISRWSTLKDIKVEILQEKGDETSAFLLVILLNRDFTDIFSVLCEDLIYQLLNLSKEKELIDQILNRLVKWKTLFESISSKGLSEESQRGLYGELYFLRKLLLRKIEVYKTIECWLGPSGAVHDFQYGSWAVEVKTTHGKNHQKIQISSERQLDNSIIPSVYLYHLSLDVRLDFGEKLTDIIQSIKQILNSNISAKNTFETKLHEVGFFEFHSEIYQSKGFSIRNEHSYLVKDGFPRITENQLDNGVGDVKYSILVSSIEQFQIEKYFLENNLTF